MRDEKEIKNYVILGIVVAGIVAIALIAYFINQNNSEIDIPNEYTKIGEMEDSKQRLEDASTEIGKTVGEAEKNNSSDTTNSAKSNNKSNNVNKNKSDTSETTSTGTKSSDDESNMEKDSTTIKTNNNETDSSSKTENTEITFQRPVNGQIIRGFASENLVYSETLKEWITHNGIDIASDKTSVVVATEKGTVSAIKNDPRYGLTVIINHDNGYQTVYSNLLTAEFVVEGEAVTQGQTIGTIGNSASFEICDEYHLHFEILKDNKYLDPTIYISFD